MWVGTKLIWSWNAKLFLRMIKCMVNVDLQSCAAV